MTAPTKRETALDRIRAEIQSMSATNKDSPTIPNVKKGTVRLESIQSLPGAVSERCRNLIALGRDPDPDKQIDPDKLVRAVVADLVRAGVNDETIYGTLVDDRFKISEHVLSHNGDTERYVLRAIQRVKEYAIDPRLVELNDQHAVIENYGGRCRIIEELQDDDAGRSALTFQSFDDFRNRYQHRKISLGYDGKGKPVQAPLGTWWLEHPARKQYRSVAFSPGKEIDGVYNLWRGFSVKPKPGDKHQRYLDHIKENICNNNEEVFSYLLNWMARAIQKPNAPAEVAIVLRGKKGTGKSLFADVFGSLFGRHYWAVSDAKHIVGNFNAHLRDCVVLFGDEAFWAGDKQHEGVLKTLITGSTIVVERKGVDAESAPNNVHLIMASNSQWVVPATYEERRFLVLDVAPTHMQDKIYFGAIDADMESGGLANLLHMLQTRDLSNFDHRSVPDTDALQDQKVHSMEPFEEWWFRKLCENSLHMSHSEWEAPIPKDVLVDDYFLYAQKSAARKRTSATLLCRFIEKCTPDLEAFSAMYRRLEKNGDPLSTRVMWWKFPSLASCRAGFTEYMGSGNALQWPTIVVKDPTPTPPNSPPPGTPPKQPPPTTENLPFKSKSVPFYGRDLKMPKYSVSVSGQIYDRLQASVKSTSLAKFVDGLITGALDDPAIRDRVVGKCTRKSR